MQFVGKTETLFIDRLSKHRPDVSDKSAIPAFQYFSNILHSFNNQEKSPLIEAIQNINKRKQNFQNVFNKRVSVSSL